MTRCSQFLAAAAVFAAAVSFDCTAAPLYRVSAQLVDKGQPIGAPTLVVEDGSPASVGVGPAGWRLLSVTVTDIAQDRIRVATSIQARDHVATPTVVVRPGNRPRFRLATLG